MNTDPTLRKKVAQWLEEAYETEDDRACEDLAGKVLSVSPDNPEALLLLAEVFQGDEDEYRDRLRHVLKVLDRPERDWASLLSEGCLPEWLKAASLQRLSFSLLGDENSADDLALASVQTLDTGYGHQYVESGGAVRQALLQAYDLAGNPVWSFTPAK